jgi:thiol-disulfide isomerase/thioredoxin
MAAALWPLVAAGGLVISGCSGPTPSGQPKGNAPAEPAAAATGKTPEEPAATPVEKPPVKAAVTMLDKAAYERFLREHSGKPVLVDFWATWCIPCVKLLPHTAELAERYGERGLVVAPISLDDPDSEADVREMLASKGAAGLVNFLAQPEPAGPDSNPFTTFEIPGGSLPHVKIYGRDGNLSKALGSASKTIDPHEIDRAVEEALAAPPPAGG